MYDANKTTSSSISVSDLSESVADRLTGTDPFSLGFPATSARTHDRSMECEGRRPVGSPYDLLAELLKNAENSLAKNHHHVLQQFFCGGPQPGPDAGGGGGCTVDGTNPACPDASSTSISASPGPGSMMILAPSTTAGLLECVERVAEENRSLRSQLDRTAAEFNLGCYPTFRSCQPAGFNTLFPQLMNEEIMPVMDKHINAPRGLPVDPAQPPAYRPTPPQGELPPVLPGEVEGEFLDGKLQHPSSTKSRKSDKERFELLNVWSEQKRRPGAAKKDKKVTLLHSKTLQSLSTLESKPAEQPPVIKKNEAQAYTSRMSFFMVHPYNTKKGVWDVASLALVLLDMILIPLGFFDLPEHPFLTGTAWTTRIFWTFDMPFSFLAGYITVDGAIEMRPSRVASKYLKGWFWLDTVVVSIDWTEVLMASIAEGLGFARMSKVTRIFRVIRLVRLLRMARMKEVLNLLMERIDSEKLVILLDVSKLLLVMLGVGHLLGCSWFLVGRLSSEQYPEANWVKEESYEDAEIGLQYLMSIRWAMSQFAGGMDEVTPKNIYEHLFAGVVFVSAFWFGAVFLGILTSSMTQFYVIGSQQTTQLTTLRRYLSQNGISKNLSLRVQRNAQHAMEEEANSMPESSVTLMNIVSEPLRVELHFEMYNSIVSVHPFFAKFSATCPHVMRKICHSAMQMMWVSAGDVMFNDGEIPAQPRMMIVKEGMLLYSKNGEDAHVRPGEWVCEATLWVPWVHRGSMICRMDAKMYTMDASEFQSICASFEYPNGFDPRSYAHEFVEALNALDSDVVSDLEIQGRWDDSADDHDLSKMSSTRSLKFGHRSSGGKRPKRSSPSSKKLGVRLKSIANLDWNILHQNEAPSRFVWSPRRESVNSTPPRRDSGSSETSRRISTDSSISPLPNDLRESDDSLSSCAEPPPPMENPPPPTPNFAHSAPDRGLRQAAAGRESGKQEAVELQKCLEAPKSSDDSNCFGLPKRTISSLGMSMNTSNLGRSRPLVDRVPDGFHMSPQSPLWFTHGPPSIPPLRRDRLGGSGSLASELAQKYQVGRVDSPLMMGTGEHSTIYLDEEEV